MYWIHISRLFSKQSWNMYWRKSIEDLYEKCSTNRVFRIQFQKTAARTLFLKTAIGIGGRAARMLLHALCVFLCSPLFDCEMRTLFVLRPLLGKNEKSNTHNKTNKKSKNSHKKHKNTKEAQKQQTIRKTNIVSFVVFVFFMCCFRLLFFCMWVMCQITDRTAQRIKDAWPRDRQQKQKKQHQTKTH